MKIKKIVVKFYKSKNERITYITDPDTVIQKSFRVKFKDEWQLVLPIKYFNVYEIVTKRI